MLFRNKYINKTASSILLVALLLIHSVKLLHSHPGNTLVSKDIHKNCVSVKSNSDCSICSYQLAKDTDSPIAYNNEVPPPEQDIFNLELIESYRNYPHSAFESRGPPSSI